MEALREQYLLLISTSVYLLVIGAEVFFFQWRQQAVYPWRDTLTNAGKQVFCRELHFHRPEKSFDRNHFTAPAALTTFGVDIFSNQYYLAN